MIDLHNDKGTNTTWHYTRWSKPAAAAVAVYDCDTIAVFSLGFRELRLLLLLLLVSAAFGPARDSCCCCVPDIIKQPIYNTKKAVRLSLSQPQDRDRSLLSLLLLIAQLIKRPLLLLCTVQPDSSRRCLINRNFLLSFAALPCSQQQQQQSRLPQLPSTLFVVVVFFICIRKDRKSYLTQK